MSSRSWLVVLGCGLIGWSAAHAQQAPPPVPSTSTPAAAVAAPPFWLAGVVITATQRSALLVLLDEARREVGAITLREGETFSGYRVAAVESSRVLLDRDGVVVPVVVGRPYTGPRGIPLAGPRTPIFIPGPDRPTPDIPYTGPQVKRDGRRAGGGDGEAAAPDPEGMENFLLRLFSHPQMQQTLEEIRPAIRQRMERGGQDGRPAPGR